MNTKNILITGGTGFLGRALVKQWQERDCLITVLSRDPPAAMRLLGPKIIATGNLRQLPADANFDAVVNLAGAPIFGSRWSQARKQLLRDSRIAFTERLLEYISGLTLKPEVLLSGSAIGVYGNQGEIRLTENSLGKPDFSQRLCEDWENAALKAERMGVRVCLIRTGLVLDSGGGMLSRMLPAFKLGLGGRLGDGRQWMSWIHRRDWAAIVDDLLNNPSLHGAFNATAPQAVTNREFSERLAKQLRRPMLMPLPESLLKLLLGEMAELVLGSQRVIPERLLAEGFEFQFSHLESALQQILPSHA